MGGILAASDVNNKLRLSQNTEGLAGDDNYRSDPQTDTCPRVPGVAYAWSPLPGHSHNSLPVPSPAWPDSNGLIAVLLPGSPTWDMAIQPEHYITFVLRGKYPPPCVYCYKARYLYVNFPCVAVTQQLKYTLPGFGVSLPNAAVAPHSHFPAKPPPSSSSALFLN